MKNLIIITNKKVTEFDKFGFQNGHNSFSNDKQNIIVYDNSVRGELADTSISPIADGSILLHHGDSIVNYTPKFNVGTNGNETAQGTDRWYYEKLLNANFQGAIDTDEKKKVFDEVWEYFEKKNCEINQHKIALSILDWINKKGDQNDLTAEQKALIEDVDIKKLYDPIPNKGSLDTKNCENMKIYTEFKEKLFEKYKDPSLKKNSTN